MATTLDTSFASGMHGEGDDWSFAKSSERKDRPLTADQLKELLVRSDEEGFKQLGKQLAMIVAMLVLVRSSESWLLSAVATVVLGFGMVTMGHCAQHESIHGTAFKSKKYNELVSWAVSLPRFTNPVHEKLLHKHHHTYTNNPNKDPELLAGSPRNKIPGDMTGYFHTLFRIGGGRYGLGCYSSRFGLLINCASGVPVGYSGFDLLPENQANRVRGKLQATATKQLAFYFFLFIFLTWQNLWFSALKYWLIPLVLGEPLHAIFHMSDHLNCAHDHKNGRTNTRTTLAPSFVSFNLWNMNYHAEHHLYPSIPFHKLPTAHKMLDGHFKNVSNSALEMHQDLINKWIPYLVSRKKEGGQKAIEEDWIPYDNSSKKAA